MLGERLRHCPDITPTLVQCLVCAGILTRVRRAWGSQRRKMWFRTPLYKWHFNNDFILRMKIARYECRGLGFVHFDGIQVSKKVFLPRPLIKIEYGGEVECSASDSQGSNIESCDYMLQCHLICLTIPRRISWSSSACIYTDHCDCVGCPNGW